MKFVLSQIFFAASIHFSRKHQMSQQDSLKYHLIICSVTLIAGSQAAEEADVFFLQPVLKNNHKATPEEQGHLVFTASQRRFLKLGLKEI